MTVREYRLREMGYWRMINEQWKQTRWLGWQVVLGWADHDKLPSIFEYYPLDGDPTKEQMEAAKEKQAVADKQWSNDLVAKMIANGKLKTNKHWKKDSK
jgi:hypothetical protein